MSKSPVSSFVKGEFNGDLRRKRKMYNILNSKRGFVLLLITVFAAVSFSVSGAAVSSRSSSSSSSFRKDGDSDEDRRGAVRDFVMAIVGGMLRHPDPIIRKQAIQTIATGVTGDREGSTDSGNGIRSLFAFGDGGGSDEEGSTGAGGAVFIPDLYVLLADPDPEVRDVASVGLDVVFQTDTTLLRFMNDADPLIRKYATQIYAKKGFSGDRRDTSNENEEGGELSDLLALRTMMVRLKHEEDPGVRKVIVDTLNWYIREGGDDREGSRDSRYGYGGDIFGVDITLLTKYLNDENPEMRKQAIKTIAQRESGDDILIKLMERLKIEEDPEVKKELLKALDEVRRTQRYDREGAEGVAGGAPRP
jgi:hypothetical protein